LPAMRTQVGRVSLHDMSTAVRQAWQPRSEGRAVQVVRGGAMNAWDYVGISIVCVLVIYGTLSAVHDLMNFI